MTSSSTPEARLSTEKAQAIELANNMSDENHPEAKKTNTLTEAEINAIGIAADLCDTDHPAAGELQDVSALDGLERVMLARGVPQHHGVLAKVRAIRTKINAANNRPHGR